MFEVHPSFREWVKCAAQREEAALAVERVYREVQAAIDLRKPRCSLSGRCCRFEEYGHQLYVTTLEVAVFVRRLEQAGRASPFPAVKGGCPFQVGKLCGVHAIRPFGCRVFFCDVEATDWQQEQYERFHAELRRLHTELGVPYAYVEWRAALAELEPMVCGRIGISVNSRD